MVQVKVKSYPHIINEMENFHVSNIIYALQVITDNPLL